MNDHLCSDPSHSHDLTSDDSLVSHLSYVQTSNVRALNESLPGSCRLVFKPHSLRASPTPSCSSNSGDPELLVHVPFSGAVHLRSMSLGGGAGGCAPARVLLFVNREDVDFDNARDRTPEQELKLLDPDEHDFGGGSVDFPLRAAKFQNVTSVTLFFPESFGGETSTITYIGFKGVATNVKREAVECVYETRGNVADHKVEGDEVKGRSGV